MGEVGLGIGIGPGWRGVEEGVEGGEGGEGGVVTGVAAKRCASGRRGGGGGGGHVVVRREEEGLVLLVIGAWKEVAGRSAVVVFVEVEKLSGDGAGDTLLLPNNTLFYNQP